MKQSRIGLGVVTMLSIFVVCHVRIGAVFSKQGIPNP